MAIVFACGTVLSAIATATQAQGVAIKSSECRAIYNEMPGKPRFKAMALSTDGTICHAEWGHQSSRRAETRALSGCEGNNERTCRIILRE